MFALEFQASGWYLGPVVSEILHGPYIVKDESGSLGFLERDSPNSMKAPSEEEQPGPKMRLENRSYGESVQINIYKPPLVQNITSSLSGLLLLSKK